MNLEFIVSASGWDIEETTYPNIILEFEDIFLVAKFKQFKQNNDVIKKLVHYYIITLINDNI